MTIQQAIQSATQHHASGKLAEAEGLYRQILTQDPNHAAALHGLGMLACEVGQVAMGMELFRKAAAADPLVADYHNHLGQALGQQGAFEEAERECRQAIQLGPAFPDAYINLGEALRGLGKLQEAADAYETAIAKQKNHAIAHNNLGITLRSLGRLKEAELVLSRLVKIAPDLAEGHSNLATVLMTLKKLPQAEKELRQAISLNEEYVEAHVNLADLLADEKRSDEAVKHALRAMELNPPASLLNRIAVLLAKLGEMDRAYEAANRAAQLAPSQPDILCNLANILRELGRLSEGEAYCRKAIAIDPTMPEAYSNLGMILLKQLRGDEAEAALREAVRLRPKYVEALNGLGLVLSRQDSLDESIECLRKAAEYGPDRAPVHMNLANGLLSQGYLEEALAEYRYAVQAEPDSSQHLSNLIYALQLDPTCDGAALLAEHKRWAKRFAAPLARTIAPFTNDRSLDRRLRVGYVSPDFFNHPVGRFLQPLFAHHDHNRFEIICYSDGAMEDHVTANIKAGADEWHKILGRTDEQLATRIREDRIDILVDLALHTADNRMLVFARKPAPVQVTYLAYPGTSGLSIMDWRITDGFIDPPGATEFYTERSMRLSYWCYRAAREAPEVEPTLAATKNGFVTFGCLNSFHKVGDSALSTWARIVAASEGSRMIIHSKPGKHLDRVRKAFAAQGVSNDRIEFIPTLGLKEYFANHGRIDIGLDPFPYNGGTSTCDALWMGVLVVTLSGDVGVRRSGSSLLNQVGLGDLVANTEEQYVQIALKLARDLDRLQELRGTLRERMAGSQLMDETGFTRDMEHAFLAMWEAYCLRDEKVG